MAVPAIKFALITAMKSSIRSRRSAGVVFSAILTLAAAPFCAAEEKTAKPEKTANKDEKKASPTSEESMAAWMAVATPGPQHKLLAAYVGKWDVSSKMWMAPETQAMESKGKAEAQMILGGRFCELKQTGSMMGMPWEARALTGYDNFRKQFQSLWIDNMGTTMILTTGKVSDDGKIFTYEGKMDEPATGEKDKPFTVVEKHVSKDEIVTELFTKVDGKEFKFLEATYKRAK
jgi:hypothetical protein